MSRKIIIDTDPGIDDAMAILLALKSPEVALIGLTTTFGNVRTELATDNALRIVEFADRADIPVAHGAERPLIRELGSVADVVTEGVAMGQTILDHRQRWLQPHGWSGRPPVLAVDSAGVLALYREQLSRVG